MAVETVDALTKQDLKFGGGKQEWKEFFRLTSSAIALREGLPRVPGTSLEGLHERIESLSNLIKVLPLFEGIGNVVHTVPDNAVYVLQHT